MFEVKAKRLLRIVVEGMQMLVLHPSRRKGGCQIENDEGGLVKQETRPGTPLNFMEGSRVRVRRIWGRV